MFSKARLIVSVNVALSFGQTVDSFCGSGVSFAQYSKAEPTPELARVNLVVIKLTKGFQCKITFGSLLNA